MSKIQDLKTSFEQHLRLSMPEENPLYAELFQAARHSLFSPAKRLRPLLILSTGEALGLSPSLLMQTASAYEMLHTYSLIHDDLPCMDDASMRRGQKSLHKAFKESTALLAADFLLTYSFEILSSDPLLEDFQKIKLISLLAKAAGAHGMIGGQIMDLDSSRKDLKKIQTLHEKKTAALFSACLESAGIAAKLDDSSLKNLRDCGQKLGLAFQITDDLLDKHGDAHSLGKPQGIDAEKDTYLSLLGLSQAKERARESFEQALKELDKLPFDFQILKELAAFCIQRKH